MSWAIKKSSFKFSQFLCECYFHKVQTNHCYCEHAALHSQFLMTILSVFVFVRCACKSQPKSNIELPTCRSGDGDINCMSCECIEYFDKITHKHKSIWFRFTKINRYFNLFVNTQSVQLLSVCLFFVHFLSLSLHTPNFGISDYYFERFISTTT